MQFDVSSISNASAVKFRSVRTCTKVLSGSGASLGSYDGIQVQYCKSTNTSTTGYTPSSTTLAAWNDFTGHSGSTWDETDTTNYSSVISIASASLPSSGTFSEDTLNSTALSDINADSTFRICTMEYEEYHTGNVQSSWTRGTSLTGEASKFYDAINSVGTGLNPGYASSDVKHLEITVPASSSPTENATFFGANF